MSGVGAIVLAAGNSSRLGQPKQLLPHEHGTLIENAVQVATDAGCDPIVVVTGAIDEPIRQRVGERAVVTHNADWSAGMGGSIRVGLVSVLQTAATVERVFILLSDQPALNVAILQQLLARWDQSARAMAACVYGGSIGPPCGFDRSRFDTLANLRADQGAKALLQPADQVATIDWPDGGFDIDTPDDLERWKDR